MFLINFNHSTIHFLGRSDDWIDFGVLFVFFTVALCLIVLSISPIKKLCTKTQNGTKLKIKRKAIKLDFKNIIIVEHY